MSNNSTELANNSNTSASPLTQEKIISIVIAVIGLALLIYGIVNINTGRLITPQESAQARVDKEENLSRAEESSLFQRQFNAATEQKFQWFTRGIISALLGLVLIWLSRHWQEWRHLYGEQMLYGYAFLIPPIGWVLYLFAYPTRGDPNREVIRRNIGIMSLAVVAGSIGYYLTFLLQAFVISPLGNSLATNQIIAGLFNFLLSPQIAQLVGIAAGGYVAFRTRDVRAIAVAAQLVVLALVLALFGWLGANGRQGIERQGLSVADYTFIEQTAGFDISETLMKYDRTSTYGQAFIVGLLNTLLVTSVGIFLSSVLGLIVGVARLSNNWLTNTIARIFVELMRNIPLLVLMFFLYAGVLLQLPRRDDTITLFNGSILLNNRGVAIPWYKATETYSNWIPFLIAGVIIAAIVWYIRNRPMKVTGRPAFNFLFVILSLLIVPIIGIALVNPLVLEYPVREGASFVKNTETQNFLGQVMSPEFFGLLLSLVLYTGGHIGEVVRAGINAVSKGQREAAQALGLSSSQSLQLIVLPQALRVIIPPLTNQYLNLAKNSSLAIAVGYADLYFVANTTFNQSGKSVEVVLMIMASYLAISLSISAVMNFINGRIQLKER